MFRPTLTLTLNNAKTALDAGLRAIEGGQTEIDLAQLTIVDSAAVATLLGWQRAACARHQSLVFINVPPSLQRLAQLYDVADFLTIATLAGSDQVGAAGHVDALPLT